MDDVKTKKEDESGAEVEDQVWDANIAEHSGTGSFGKFLSDLGVDVTDIDTDVATVDGKVDDVGKKVDDTQALIFAK